MYQPTTYWSFVIDCIIKHFINCLNNKYSWRDIVQYIDLMRTEKLLTCFALFSFYSSLFGPCHQVLMCRTPAVEIKGFMSRKLFSTTVLCFLLSVTYFLCKTQYCLPCLGKERINQQQQCNEIRSSKQPSLATHQNGAESTD